MNFIKLTSLENKSRFPFKMPTLIPTKMTTVILSKIGQQATPPLPKLNKESVFVAAN